MTRLEAAGIVIVAGLILVLGLWLGLAAIWSKRKIPTRIPPPYDGPTLTVEDTPAGRAIAEHGGMIARTGQLVPPDRVIVLKARKVGHTAAMLQTPLPPQDPPSHVQFFDGRRHRGFVDFARDHLGDRGDAFPIDQGEVDLWVPPSFEFDFPPLHERPSTPRFYNQEGARPWKD